jgi:hypothetical protein
MGYKAKRQVRIPGRPKTKLSRWQLAAIPGGVPWAQVCAIAAQGERWAAVWARRKLDRARWDMETASQQRAFREQSGLPWSTYPDAPVPFTHAEQKRLTANQSQKGRFEI